MLEIFDMRQMRLIFEDQQFERLLAMKERMERARKKKLSWERFLLSKCERGERKC